MATIETLQPSQSSGHDATDRGNFRSGRDVLITIGTITGFVLVLMTLA